MGNEDHSHFSGGLTLTENDHGSEQSALSESTGNEQSTVKLRVFRYKNLPKDDTSAPSTSFDTFQVPISNGTTLLDALIYVKEKLDPTLTFRYSCRMGICGSCGVNANGKEKLACKTQVKDLGENIEVRPLNNLSLIRDLTVDFKPFIEKNVKVKPYLVRNDVDVDGGFNREFRQTPDELNQYLMFANCLMCGLCYSACPTNATDELYLGPKALARAYRYIADSRDGGQLERIEIVDQEHAAWSCHFAGSCSDVCPKGVDPAFAIQQLKALALRKQGLLKRKKPSPLVERPRESVNPV